MVLQGCGAGVVQHQIAGVVGLARGRTARGVRRIDHEQFRSTIAAIFCAQIGEKCRCAQCFCRAAGEMRQVHGEDIVHERVSFVVEEVPRVPRILAVCGWCGRVCAAGAVGGGARVRGVNAFYRCEIRA